MNMSIYSPYKTVWWIPEFILIACKKYLLLEINTILEFLPFRMKYIIDGGCLFDDWYI